jgi:hypothetical protein
LSALHREQLRRMHAVLTPPTWSDSHSKVHISSPED